MLLVNGMTFVSWHHTNGMASRIVRLVSYRYYGSLISMPTYGCPIPGLVSISVAWKVEIELTTHGEFLCTVRFKVLNRLGSESISCIDGKGGMTFRLSE